MQSGQEEGLLPNVYETGDRRVLRKSGVGVPILCFMAVWAVPETWFRGRFIVYLKIMRPSLIVVRNLHVGSNMVTARTSLLVEATIIRPCGGMAIDACDN